MQLFVLEISGGLIVVSASNLQQAKQLLDTFKQQIDLQQLKPLDKATQQNQNIAKLSVFQNQINDKSIFASVVL